MYSSMPGSCRTGRSRRLEQLAMEAETALRGEQFSAMLRALHPSGHLQWAPDLRGAVRVATITKVLTRLRTCSDDGVMESTFSGPPKLTPQGFHPWFDVPDRRNATAAIVFGHWAAMGLHVSPKICSDWIAAACMGDNSPRCDWRTGRSFKCVVRKRVEASEPPVTVGWPRYSSRLLPTYRFLPGLTPHPRHNPLGHSFGQPEPRPRPCEHDHWSHSKDYLYAIDLYNFAYWWEAHEVLEGLWHACGRTTTAGNFFQALIQFAAAHLKRALGNEPAAHNLVSLRAPTPEELPHTLHGA
jgi:hypothetical protein